MWTLAEGNVNMVTWGTFLPTNYSLPVTPSSFTKFEEWETVRIRILPSGMETDCMVFWEYFDESGEKAKPVRSMKAFESTPWIWEDWKIKEVWAFKVWNYNIEQVQLCSIPQKTVKEAILWFINDEDYWNPLSYDIKVTKSWKWFDTVYKVNPAPIKEFDGSLIEWKDKEIDWFKYLEWEQPFKS